MVLASAVNAADPHMTLREVAQKAILTSPEVQTKWYAFMSAANEVDIVRAGFLPRVDITTGTGRESISQSPAAQTNFTRNGYTLTLNQMVYDGFTTSNDLKRFGRAKLTRYFELLEAAENTALEAARAYVDVIRFRYQLDLAERNYIEHRAVYELLTQRVLSGAGRRVDVEHAESRLSLAEVNLQTETANLHDVTARYMRLVSEAPPKVLYVPARLGGQMPGSAGEALKIAAKQNPTLRAAIENVEASKLDLAARRGAFQPRVDLKLRSDVTDNYQGANTGRRNNVAELVLNFNIFNGGADTARSRQYAERKNQALELRDKACRDIRQTLVIAVNDVKRLRTQLGLLGNQVSAIEKTRDAYRAQFNIGQRSLLDLLDTENELLTARRTEIGADLDLALALLRVRAGMGTLLSFLELKHHESDLLPNEEDFTSVVESDLCPLDTPPVPEPDLANLTARALASLEPPKPVALPVRPLSLPITVPAPLPLPSAVLPAPTFETPVVEPTVPAVAPAVVSAAASAVEATVEAAPVSAPLPVPTPPPVAVPPPAPEDVVRQRIADWAAAWSSKDTATYLGLYASHFVPAGGLSRSVWRQQREQRLSSAAEIKVEVQNLEVAIKEGVAIATFDLSFVSGTYRDTSRKTLEWAERDGVWAIRRESTKNIVVAPKPETKTPAAPAAKAELTPKAAPLEMPPVPLVPPVATVSSVPGVPEIPAAAPVAKPDITPEPTPVVAASAAPAAELTPLVDGTALVRQRVTDWADAWSRKDVAVYLGFYADKFAPAGSMPLPEWRRLREQRLSASADVRVEVSNLTAGLTNGVAETRFDQSYQSASYRETSRKTLEWIEQDGVWKIQRETVRNVVAERVLPVRTATARERLPAQEAPPPEKPVSSVTEKDLIHKRIMAWADTWARNDFSAYHDFYREGFVQEGGASWADWRRRRGSEGADVANVIAPRIEIEDLTLNVDGDRAVARFEQVWGSGAEVRERFQKVLEWEKREGRWLIHREAATPVAGVKMETKEALK